MSSVLEELNVPFFLFVSYSLCLDSAVYLLSLICLRHKTLLTPYFFNVVSLTCF